MKQEPLNHLHLLLQKINQLAQIQSAQSIAIQTVEEIIIINRHDIVYCSSDVNYTNIWLLNKQKLVISKNLGTVEQLINSPFFYRIHQSYLINILWLKTVKKIKGSAVLLENNVQLTISGRKKQAFIRHLQKVLLTI